MLFRSVGVMAVTGNAVLSSVPLHVFGRRTAPMASSGGGNRLASLAICLFYGHMRQGCENQPTSNLCPLKVILAITCISTGLSMPCTLVLDSVETGSPLSGARISDTASHNKHRTARLAAASTWNVPSLPILHRYRVSSRPRRQKLPVDDWASPRYLGKWA